MTLEMQQKQAAGTQSNNTAGIEGKEMAGLGMQKAATGLRLVHVSRNIRATELREATTGRPIAVPRIWAVAEPAAAAAPSKPAATKREILAEKHPKPPKTELAFYRKYTEAMLRRYERLSTQPGRTPSLMGRELFRGDASHYTLTTFEDEVTFSVDVERCLTKLRKDDQRLIRRIALQGYTHEEAAPLLGITFKTCVVNYGTALDRLTEIFMAARLLEPQKILSRP